MNEEQAVKLERIIEGEYVNTAGITVLQNGKKIYENSFSGCSSNDPVHIASVTKSIISILIGIAVDKGFIKSIDEKILNFFPDYTITEGDETIKYITIKDMLTMTAPYKPEAELYEEFFEHDDWVRAALDLVGGAGRIGQFRYAPIIGPDILSGIIVKATGKSALDFATENLFAPLGIDAGARITLGNREEHFAYYKDRGKNVRGWVADSMGVNTAGWGLALTSADMAKIGQLYLNEGEYNGKQIVSSKWIKESTKPQSKWEEMNLFYGYLWWITGENEYAAMGDGGNIIYVNKDKNLVVAITALFMPEARDRIEFIKMHIEPLL